MKKSDKITQELKRIAAENGGLLSPEAVVESARAKSSPLHSRFQWDDSAAAHEYRLWQARQLIRVCVEILPNHNKPVNAFVSLSSDRKPDGGYRLMPKVLSDKALRDQMLADALAEFELFQQKYQDLRELAELFRVGNKLKIMHQQGKR